MIFPLGLGHVTILGMQLPDLILKENMCSTSRLSYKRKLSSLS